jgi:hypothetical protein
MEIPEEQENNRNADGTFKPGVSGNPGGCPVGSVAGMFRKKFKEQPDTLRSGLISYLKILQTVRR